MERIKKVLGLMRPRGPAVAKGGGIAIDVVTHVFLFNRTVIA